MEAKHDDLCPGCEYERKRKANHGLAARSEGEHGSARVLCSECGHECYEEMAHIVTDTKGRRYICPSCLAGIPVMDRHDAVQE
jgi:hypothetical protein